MSGFGDYLSCVSVLPYAFEGELHDGVLKKQLKYCRDKCTTRDCIALSERPSGHYLCSKGFSCIPVALGPHRVVINGIIASEQNRTLTGAKRALYRTNVVTQEEIDFSVENLLKAFREHLEASNDGAKDAVGFFHDIRTSVGVVLSWCQELIATSPGKSFEDKLGSADRNTHNLFRAINLLQEQLELADIIANPSAISYGHKAPSSLIDFWYRMVKLFEPRASRKGIDIKFHAYGNQITVEAFNSIQFLPLILLDNAIKYSFRDRTIYVDLSVRSGDVTVAVSSFGKTVPKEFREKIFEKRVRGPNGIEENPEGMGMGLFIAEQIVTAHGFQIFYEPPEPDVPVGSNKFVVKIPKAAVLRTRF